MLSGSGGEGPEAGAEPLGARFDGTVRDIVVSYEEVVRLEGEILRAPVDIKTLLPDYVRGLPPEHFRMLTPRVALLGERLRAIDAIVARVRPLIRSLAPFGAMDAAVRQGVAPMEALKTLVLRFFPAAPAPGAKKGDDPQYLLRFFMAWFVSLCESWDAVLALSWM